MADFTYRASREMLPLTLCMSLYHRLQGPCLIFYVSNSPEGLKFEAELTAFAANRYSNVSKL